MKVGNYEGKRGHGFDNENTANWKKITKPAKLNQRFESCKPSRNRALPETVPV